MNCMASTSPQSSSPLPSCLEKPLPLDGFQGTPDEVEQQWYDQVYLGSGDRMKQLTWRAVIVGMLLGSILSLTNLYANLKMGWSFGVALTAGIISFALWNAFVRLGISKSPMTILENTCMQSAASSAGYSTGGTLTSAVAALLLLTGQHMPLGTTFAWIFFIAVLGVTMAIPMKRQMINIEQIRFPDSIATAETLKVLYSEGKKAAGQAKALLYSALFAAANAIAMAAGGERWLGTVQQHILGNWYQRTIFFKWDLMFVGAGALVGMKTSLSLFIGGTVCWALYVPWLESQKLLPAGAGYRESVSWTLWGGTACMVVASIVAFLFQWKSIVRSFSSLGAMFSLSKKRKLTDVENLEECELVVRQSLGEIEEAAAETIAENGYDYDVTAELEHTSFPVKNYGSYTFPAGDYEALRIVIGEGNGHNWWCVMYPNMCFSDSMYEVVDKEAGEKLREVLTTEEYEKVLAEGDYQVRMKYFSWLNPYLEKLAEN